MLLCFSLLFSLFLIVFAEERHDGCAGYLTIYAQAGITTNDIKPEPLCMSNTQNRYMVRWSFTNTAPLTFNIPAGDCYNSFSPNGSAHPPTLFPSGSVKQHSFEVWTVNDVCQSWLLADTRVTVCGDTDLPKCSDHLASLQLDNQANEIQLEGKSDSLTQLAACLTRSPSTCAGARSCVMSGGLCLSGATLAHSCHSKRSQSECEGSGCEWVDGGSGSVCIPNSRGMTERHHVLLSLLRPGSSPFASVEKTLEANEATIKCMLLDKNDCDSTSLCEWLEPDDSGSSGICVSVQRSDVGCARHHNERLCVLDDNHGCWWDGEICRGIRSSNATLRITETALSPDYSSDVRTAACVLLDSRLCERASQCTLTPVGVCLPSSIPGVKCFRSRTADDCAQQGQCAWLSEKSGGNESWDQLCVPADLANSALTSQDPSVATTVSDYSRRILFGHVTNNRGDSSSTDNRNPTLSCFLLPRADCISAKYRGICSWLGVNSMCVPRELPSDACFGLEKIQCESLDNCSYVSSGENSVCVPRVLMMAHTHQETQVGDNSKLRHCYDASDESECISMGCLYWNERERCIPRFTYNKPGITARDVDWLQSGLQSIARYSPEYSQLALSASCYLLDRSGCEVSRGCSMVSLDLCVPSAVAQSTCFSQVSQYGCIAHTECYWGVESESSLGSDIYGVCYPRSLSDVYLYSRYQSKNSDITTGTTTQGSIHAVVSSLVRRSACVALDNISCISMSECKWIKIENNPRVGFCIADTPTLL